MRKGPAVMAIITRTATLSVTATARFNTAALGDLAVALMWAAAPGLNIDIVQAMTRSAPAPGATGFPGAPGGWLITAPIVRPVQ